MKKTFVLGVLAIAAASFALSQTSPAADDPKEKLGLLVGRWEIEMNSTGKVTARGKTKTVRECRWAPQGHDFLVCALTATSPQGDHRQLTVYSYNDKESNYVVIIIVNPGAKPQPAASLSIHGNVWTSVTPSEAAGKTRQMRSTVDRSATGPATMKVEASEDGGAHWTLMASGSERKISD